MSALFVANLCELCKARTEQYHAGFFTMLGVLSAQTRRERHLTPSKFKKEIKIILDTVVSELTLMYAATSYSLAYRYGVSISTNQREVIQLGGEHYGQYCAVIGLYCFTRSRDFQMLNFHYTIYCKLSLTQVLCGLIDVE